MTCNRRSQIDQLKPARHLRGNSLFVKINSADRRDVGRRQTDCGPDEIMIAENTVGRIETNPARARKKNFRPRMQRTFRPPRFRIALAQVAARQPRRESHLTQNLREQDRHIAAGAAAQPERFCGRQRRAFFASLVTDAFMQPLVKLDQTS